MSDSKISKGDLIVVWVAGTLGVLSILAIFGLLIWAGVVYNSWGGLIFFSLVAVSIPIINHFAFEMTKSAWLNDAKMFMLEHPLEGKQDDISENEFGG
jgi:hypothetical protein